MTKLSKKFEVLLRKVYTTPQHKTSFSSAVRLKKTLKNDYNVILPLKTIQNWLSSQRPYTLHKYRKLNFKRNPIIATDIDQQWQADLMFLPDLAKHNHNYIGSLVCIDVVSRYLWVQPLKSKSGPVTTLAMQKVLDQASPRRPQKLQTDDGKEFFNANFTNLMKKYGVKHFATKSDKKAAIAERVIKTLKEKIYRYLDTNPSNLNYSDVLEDFVTSYNNTEHSSLKMAPAEVTPEKLGLVLQNLYGQFWDVDGEELSLSAKKFEKQPIFVVGDNVRITGPKATFEKGYRGKWTEEIFVVKSLKKSHPRTVYRLEDLQNKPIIGTFYAEEMQKVQLPDDGFYLVEKIIKSEGIGKRRRHLVKWVGYPEVFNSWVGDDDIKDLQL